VILCPHKKKAEVYSGISWNVPKKIRVHANGVMNSLPMHDASKKRKRKEMSKEEFVEMICERQSI